MIRKTLQWLGGLVAALGLLAIPAHAAQDVSAKLTCQGKFLNPITDICWSCVFPIRLAGRVILNHNSQEDNDSSPKQWVCACKNPARIGITVSFWEPTHLVEVVRTPFCMVSMGGVLLHDSSKKTADVTAQAKNPGWFEKLFGGNHTRNNPSTADESKEAFWQVHWYRNPIIYLMESLLDSDCTETGVLDVGWMTELDPTWKHPSLAVYQAPDSALFANIIAQAACAVDCVKANTGFPSKTLYWCAGCHGTIYPLSGWMGGQFSEVQAARLMVARMQAKMHRDLVAWRSSGKDSLCGYKINPVMDKTNYKMAMTYPVPARKYLGKCCEPIGRTTLIRDSGKAFPYKGNQFAFQLFRKRDCCGSPIGGNK